MSDLLKKAYEAALAAKQASEKRRDELQARYDQFKESTLCMWENLDLKEEKFTLKDGTCLSVSHKGLGFNCPATYAVLTEAEEILADYLENEAKKYDEIYNC